ncbi:MAG: helix-turn-helix transcriptional regulator [Candidatus Binatus sp.]|uniref:helix-turn-helix domain-containing protein n=1 Tax=Candidatus Binatus sp. TaxID=2811406 RepID=UPI003C775C30
MASALDISVYELLEGKELGDRRNLDRWGMSKAFGEVFKAKMDASGLEREEFIKVANISMPQYYLVVRGLVNPTILTAVEIAKRLELTVWQLLGVEPWDGLPKAAVETTAMTAAG